MYLAARARCWHTRWELTSGDSGDINTGPHLSLRDHHRIIWKRTHPAYFGNFIVAATQCKLWSWNSNQFSVRGPGSLTSFLHAHTLRLCPQNTHHPLFPTRWCSGFNSPLYNIRTSKLIKGPGLFRLLRVVPDFSSKLALVRFRRENTSKNRAILLSIYWFNPVKLSPLSLLEKTKQQFSTLHIQTRIFAESLVSLLWEQLQNIKSKWDPCFWQYLFCKWLTLCMELFPVSVDVQMFEVIFHLSNSACDHITFQTCVYFRHCKFWQEPLPRILVRVRQRVWVLSDWLRVCEGDLHWRGRQDRSVQWAS